MKMKEIFLASHFKFYIEKYDYNVSKEVLEQYSKKADSSILREIKLDYEREEIDLTPENFIYYSESIFNEEERKKNGITFTPIKIAKLMIKLSLDSFKKINVDSFKIIDPAVGGGIFLVLLIRELVSKFNASITSLIENSLFGIDVVPENVLLAKLALVLVCLENGCHIPNRINIIKYDSFKLNRTNQKELLGVDKFDLVITNPPYIRSRNLPTDIKENIKAKFETVHGITDTYIPFFEIVTNLLDSDKVGTLITPNTFLTSLNGKNLRKYLINNCKEIKLINFDSEKLFNGVSSYSAITTFVKKKNTSEQCVIKYLSNSIENYLYGGENYEANWEIVNQDHTWRTLTLEEKEIVKKLESAFALKLKNLNFKNGIATQRNNLYSFIYNEEDSENYTFTKDDVSYKIEKKITRPFIIPNQKKQIKNQRIIFPYKLNKFSGRNEVIPEAEMKSNYPLAHLYLSEYKDELSTRATDKNIPAWYAYGRSQGLNDFGFRLYIPYMAQKVNTMISENTEEIFAAGYAIFDDDVEYLKLLDSLLKSKIFTFYISMVSKPYAKNYYATTKSLIKYFSIPSKTYLEENSKSKLSEKEIFDLYGLSDEEVELIMKSINQ